MIMDLVGAIVQYERGPIGIANIMLSGSITLEQVVALAVACTRCDRTGRYKLGALIAGHGPRCTNAQGRKSQNAFNVRGHLPQRQTGAPGESAPVLAIQ
jgi:hypothetical protein